MTVSSVYGTTAAAQLSVNTTGIGSTGTLQLSPSTVISGQSVTGSACGFTTGLSSLQVTISNGSYAVQSYTEPASRLLLRLRLLHRADTNYGLSIGTYTVTVSSGYGMSATGQLSVTATGGS